MTCPAPESLVPLACGAEDPTVAGHVEGCAACQAELARLQEAAGLLRAQTAFERRTETPDCLEESAIADFVEGGLAPDVRAPIVAHLLTCARCRLVVRATGGLLADEAVSKVIPKGVDHRWRRWSLPVGLAAAAAVLLLVWPRNAGDIDLREPAPPATVVPLPVTPLAEVARADRFIWSSVPGVDRYRLRLYDEEGKLMWTAETADTIAVRPDSIALVPRMTYFWKVEAQTEWQRWAASDLAEFQLTGSRQ